MTSNKTDNKTTESAPVVATVEDDRTVYLYTAQNADGPAPFVIRKATGKGAADRPLIFDPNGASVVRYTTDAATVRRYIAETDPAKRAAMLADLPSREQDSRITPTAPLVAGWAALVASVTTTDEEGAALSAAAALLRAGIVPVPGAVRKASAAKKKKDDTTDVLSSLFA